MTQWGTGPLLPYTPTYALPHPHSSIHCLCVVWGVRKVIRCHQSEGQVYSDSNVSTALWLYCTVHRARRGASHRVLDRWAILLLFFFSLPSLSLKLIPSWGHFLLLNSCMSAWQCFFSLHSLTLVCSSVSLTSMIDDEKETESYVTEEHDGTYCAHQHSTALPHHCIVKHNQIILMYTEEWSPENYLIDAEYPMALILNSTATCWVSDGTYSQQHSYMLSILWQVSEICWVYSRGHS